VLFTVVLKDINYRDTNFYN